MENPDEISNSARLIARLERSFHGEISDSSQNSVNIKRWRCALALVDVARFLQEAGSADLGDEFAELASALSDLNNGTVHPLLEPENFGRGRVPGTSKDWRQRAKVCIAVELLVAGGQDRKQACSSIFKAHRPALDPLLPQAGRGRRDVVSLILNWRRQFEDGSVKNVEANRVYERAKRQPEYVRALEVSVRPDEAKRLAAALLADWN